MLRALTEQAEQGDGRCVRLSLARTAAWLTNRIQPGPEGDVAYDGPDAWLAERDSALGRLRYALSPVSFAGGPVDWARPPGVRGADPAGWV
ncbi:hypothetical protein ADL12_34570 [Streptomyces regalis]|uniref:Uncharacterized protein n=1 Tax=Streptomyces regalis TaxID=68262 RepID=A0A101JF19_9ACTN|nr:hypothetical protein ADL12_34570 [Streptomyces regalis]